MDSGGNLTGLEIRAASSPYPNTVTDGYAVLCLIQSVQNSLKETPRSSERESVSPGGNKIIELHKIITLEMSLSLGRRPSEANVPCASWRVGIWRLRTYVESHPH